MSIGVEWARVSLWQIVFRVDSGADRDVLDAGHGFGWDDLEGFGRKDGEVEMWTG